MKLSLEEELEYYNNILSEKTNESFCEILNNHIDMSYEELNSKLRALIKQVKKEYTGCSVVGCDKASDYCFCSACLHVIMKDIQCAHCKTYLSRDAMCKNCPKCGKEL